MSTIHIHGLSRKMGLPEPGLAWLSDCVGWWTCLVSCQASYPEAARAQPGDPLCNNTNRIPDLTIHVYNILVKLHYLYNTYTATRKMQALPEQKLDQMVLSTVAFQKSNSHRSTFFTLASSARTQTACLHLLTVDGARLGSCGTRSDSVCSEHGLRGGRKSGWPWCLIQLITRWSQSRKLEREAGLATVPTHRSQFDKIRWFDRWKLLTFLFCQARWAHVHLRLHWLDLSGFYIDVKK